MGREAPGGGSRTDRKATIHIIGIIVGVALAACIVYILGFTILGMPVWATGYLRRKRKD